MFAREDIESFSVQLQYDWVEMAKHLDVIDPIICVGVQWSPTTQAFATTAGLFGESPTCLRFSRHLFTSPFRSEPFRVEPRHACRASPVHAPPSHAEPCPSCPSQPL